MRCLGQCVCVVLLIVLLCVCWDVIHNVSCDICVVRVVYMRFWWVCMCSVVYVYMCS